MNRRCPSESAADEDTLRHEKPLRAALPSSTVDFEAEVVDFEANMEEEVVDFEAEAVDLMELLIFSSESLPRLPSSPTPNTHPPSRRTYTHSHWILNKYSVDDDAANKLKGICGI
ncbi:unnamed protein product [Fraxinus pennsylvanica]|uniref:Uncharacterized protein n=1 Tax=Fraxinus pennsylvanica TaxID=56036 RepID=A0AAD2E6M5_9LAMI|nr:unnamed protein product [Fraxinus pennsylvanica]